MTTTRLTGTGIWSGTCATATPGEAADAGAELEELGLHRAVDPRRRRRPVRPARQPARGHTTRDDRHRHPQRVDARAERDAAQHAPLTADARRPVPRAARGQPRAAHRPRQRAGQVPASRSRRMSHVPRRARCRPDTPCRPTAGCIAALGPKMLELARDPHRRHPPVPRDPRAHRGGPGGVGPDGLVASEQGVVLETDPDTARAIARSHLRSTSACPTTRTTGSARASPTTTSPTAAATGSSTRWWCGATRRRSPPGSRSTTTPAPTTCASRCSPPIRGVPRRAVAGARSEPHLTPIHHAGGRLRSPRSSRSVRSAFDHRWR